MIKVKLCDFVFSIEVRYNYSKNFFKDYLTQDEADFTISLTSDEILKESLNNLTFPLWYHENICIHKKICSILSQNGCFMMHSSAVAYEEEAYIFAAKSGTGKTTHSKLWLSTFPGSFIVNGDKPMFRLKDDAFYVYGTPWCGKEGYNKNTCVKVKALCFLHQNRENSIRRLKVTEVLPRILKQVYIPADKEEAERVLGLLDLFIEKVPAFSLKCNISEDAARLSHKILKEG